MEASTQQLWSCTVEGCGRLFQPRSAAYRHRKAKHDGKTYHCPDCKNVYTQKDSLRRHRYFKHPPPEESCGDSLVPAQKKPKTDNTGGGPSTSSPTAGSSQDEMVLAEDVETRMDRITISDALRPPSPASPLCRGFIRPPTTVPFKPSTKTYYGQEILRFLINSGDNLPVPAHVDMKPTDSQ